MPCVGVKDRQRPIGLQGPAKRPLVIVIVSQIVGPKRFGREHKQHRQPERPHRQTPPRIWPSYSKGPRACTSTLRRFTVSFSTAAFQIVCDFEASESPSSDPRSTECHRLARWIVTLAATSRPSCNWNATGLSGGL